MELETVLTRAMSAMNKETVYDLHSDTISFASAEWPVRAHIDCSGFINWCLRFSQDRKVDHPLYKKVNGGWFDTTGIYQDGLAASGYFRKLDVAKPGSLLVYPDYRVPGGLHQGHVGLVIESNGANGVDGVAQIIHCSSRNFLDTGDAIRLTGPDQWRLHPNSIVVWLEDLG